MRGSNSLSVARRPSICTVTRARAEERESFGIRCLAQCDCIFVLGGGQSNGLVGSALSRVSHSADNLWRSIRVYRAREQSGWQTVEKGTGLSGAERRGSYRFLRRRGERYGRTVAEKTVLRETWSTLAILRTIHPFFRSLSFIISLFRHLLFYFSSIHVQYRFFDLPQSRYL